MQLGKIVVPIITPFDEDGNVYEAGVVNLVKFLHKNAIKTLWILGSYGSFPLMSKSERMAMAEIAVRVAHDHDMTAIIQVGCPSVKEALMLVGHAQEIGADGIASVVPYYYSSAHYTESNFLEYFNAIRQASDLPLFYYNNPKTTGYSPTIQFVESLLRLGVVGIKDTVSDFISMVEKIRLFEDLKPDGFYLGGSSSVYYPSLAMGAKGVVCGTAVALPEIILALQSAIDREEKSEIRNIQKIIHEVRAIQGRYIGRSVSCYDILHSRGVDVGTVRKPWLRLNSAELEQTINDLKEITKSYFKW